VPLPQGAFSQDCGDDQLSKLLHVLGFINDGLISPLQGCDSSFAAKLRRQQQGHSRFWFNPRTPTDDFTIFHYAGPVVYTVHKILDKNKDTLNPGA
jgi:myosin heavy subunit